MMNLLNTILVGLKEIWAHKFRSILTMLGIILGVASLVGMAAIVKGMENGLKETMVAMGGADKVLLEEQDVPAYQEHLAEEAPGRTMTDVLALRQSAPLIRLVSPEMALNNCTLARGEKMVNPSECVGVWPAVLDMNLHTLQYGRFLTDLDEEKANEARLAAEEALKNAKSDIDIARAQGELAVAVAEMAAIRRYIQRK